MNGSGQFTKQFIKDGHLGLTDTTIANGMRGKKMLDDEIKDLADTLVKTAKYTFKKLADKELMEAQAKYFIDLFSKYRNVGFSSEEAFELVKIAARNTYINAR